MPKKLPEGPDAKKPVKKKVAAKKIDDAEKEIKPKRSAAHVDVSDDE